MQKIKEKAIVLIEALPYIQRFKDKIFVIKYGGNTMLDEKIKKAIVKDIALLKHLGINPIVVHGGGPAINKELQKANIKPTFINGLRYTDAKTMEIVKKSLTGINEEIVMMLKEEKCKAENLTPGLLKTKIKDKNLGLVGEITNVNSKAIFNKLKGGVIPVISSIGFDGKNFNNINADTAATRIAESLKAEKLTILTNVEGVYLEGKLISHLSIRQAKKGIEKGMINKGMIPKVMACVNAVQKGVKKAHLIDGTSEHTLLLEFFTDKGIGTEIVKNGN